MGPNSDWKIETEERHDIVPLCPHCNASIRNDSRSNDLLTFSNRR